MSALRSAALVFMCSLIFCLADSCHSAFAASTDSDRLSLEAQKQRASALYMELVAADKWDFDRIIRLHKAVIDECPDTERAQESLWRLSNLYLQAYDKPDYPKIIALMEQLLKRYPESPLVPHAKQRLLISYEDVGNMKAARALYEDALHANPSLLTTPEYAAFQLGYAKALAETGDRGKAKGIYEGIIAYGSSIEEWLRDIAVSRLEELGTR